MDVFEHFVWDSWSTRTVRHLPFDRIDAFVAMTKWFEALHYVVLTEQGSIQSQMHKH
jgi:hypothetical protein